jgi:hypothetical protein
MKENAINELLQAVKRGESHYRNIQSLFAFKHHQIELECNTLVDEVNESALKKGQSHKIPEDVKISFFREFDTFDINGKPCLYFFELKDNHAGYLGKYKEAIRNYPDRNFSALKKGALENSKILYVGKVKTKVGSRLSTHFGYANGKTGGLQLSFWANRISLKLSVHFIAFEENIADFINPLELELTRGLNPVIGKSK